MSRNIKITIVTLIILIASFRFFCGIFVVQPIGAIPKGKTIVYIRSGLNLPFIASADGMLDLDGKGVSLLGRGMFLGTILPIVREKQIVSFDYSETLYLMSTGGKTYSK